VLKQLRTLNFTHPPDSKDPAPHVLEIGAINTQLLDAKSVNVRAIDIHSIHPGRIEELDFMIMDQPSVPYDVLVLSMVLNCVPDATGRGAMLRKLRQSLRPGGLLFFVIPLTCLQVKKTESAYITPRQY
jgi:25S rRNA (adenine2142-N1)-methyltransferase